MVQIDADIGSLRLCRGREVSIYIDPDHRGKGVGHALLRALIEASEQRGFWTLVSGIFPENQASVRLHLKYGFRILGTRERIGKMNNVWRDVLWLERRSETVGIDCLMLTFAEINSNQAMKACNSQVIIV